MLVVPFASVSMNLITSQTIITVLDVLNSILTARILPGVTNVRGTITLFTRPILEGQKPTSFLRHNYIFEIMTSKISL